MFNDVNAEDLFGSNSVNTIQAPIKNEIDDIFGMSKPLSTQLTQPRDKHINSNLFQSQHENKKTLNVKQQPQEMPTENKSLNNIFDENTDDVEDIFSSISQKKIINKDDSGNTNSVKSKAKNTINPITPTHQKTPSNISNKLNESTSSQNKPKANPFSGTAKYDVFSMDINSEEEVGNIFSSLGKGNSNANSLFD